MSTCSNTVSTVYTYQFQLYIHIKHTSNTQVGDLKLTLLIHVFDQEMLRLFGGLVTLLRLQTHEGRHLIRSPQ